MTTTAAQPLVANARPTPAADHGPRKGKAKKSTDPAHTSKQIEDTIAQLEKSRAGDKEQELEIEREVKKANRDLSHLLSTIEAPLSRLETVQRKYMDLLAEMKRTEREHAKMKKRSDQVQKEKDTARSELLKMTSQKDRLEKLCREMQKDNKKLKDDNRHLSNSESKIREELHKRLEGLILDMDDLVQEHENPESTPANIESNELFRNKFKSHLDQYEVRDVQNFSRLRNKDLELRYQTARFEQQRKAQEQEATKTRQLTTQVATFSQTEAELRSQLNIYVEKFKQLYQVEDTLNNSNELFMTFRREMEEMSKKTKRLEKENNTLTRKHELTSSNILQMAEERQKHTKELELLRKKNENLEKLCRGMQAQGRGGAALQQAQQQVQQQARLAQQQSPAAAQASYQQSRRAVPNTRLSNGQAVAHNGAAATMNELDEEGTGSDYDDDEYELDESEGVDYDDDTEEEPHPRTVTEQRAETSLSSGASGKLPAGQKALPTYGPSPPPRALSSHPTQKLKAEQAFAGTANTPTTDAKQGVRQMDQRRQVAVNGTNH